MILALIFLGEKLTAVKIIGMVLIGTGTFLMIEKKKQIIPPPTKGVELRLYMPCSPLFLRP